MNARREWVTVSIRRRARGANLLSKECGVMKRSALLIVVALTGICLSQQDAADELKSRLRAESPAVRKSAAEELGRLGSNAPKDLIPDLIQLLKDPETKVASAAVEAIGNVGAPAVVHLLPCLKDSNASVRERSVKAIAWMDPNASVAALPQLIELLGDEDSGVRWALVRTLERIGAPAVDGLIARMKSKLAEERSTAADALGMIGPPAAKAVPTLIRVATNEYNPNAWWALERIGPAAAGQLVTLLEDKKAEVRASAAKALRGAGPAFKDVLPALVKALEDQDVSVRTAAVRSRCRATFAARSRPRRAGRDGPSSWWPPGRGSPGRGCCRCAARSGAACR